MSGKLVAVLGAGTMGAGIAQVTAQGGHSVIMRDLQLAQLKEGMGHISENLSQVVNKGLLSAQERKSILNRITITTEFAKIKEADVIIESVVENMSVKKQLFNELDHICKQDAILATNTASLSIAEIASVTMNRERVLGMHFHNPVPDIALVEIIRGFDTSDTVMTQAKDFITSIHKQYVVLENESPGYIVNRLLYVFLNEAISLYFEGIASNESIDQAMRLYVNMPLEPLRLADQIGLDILHTALCAFYDLFKNPKYLPHIRFTNMVKAGYWGIKTGRGFYHYQ